METPLSFWLKDSQNVFKLHPEISQLPSSNVVLKSGYVSEIKIISNLWCAL